MIRRDYLIVGAGVGGASVCEGIREYDKKGSIMLVGNESFLPYARQRMWTGCLGREGIEGLTYLGADWFHAEKIDLRLDTLVTQLNLERRLAVLGQGQAVEFRKACLATGSRARRPQVAGANLGNIFYLRTMRDVLALREVAESERTVVIVGGGCVAAEVAASFVQHSKAEVTLLHRGKHLWGRFLDPETASWLTEAFAERGVKMMLGETLNGFEGRTMLKNIQTKSGLRVPAGLAVVAVGVEMNLTLVANTPLSYPHGTPVNDFLETDEKGVFAVGDVAAYPDRIFGGIRRLDHLEAVIAQGRTAGANMTGKKRQRFEWVPHRSSTLFDLHLELVGDFSKLPTRLEMEGDRAKKRFIVRYFQHEAISAVVLCNQDETEVQAAKMQISERPRDIRRKRVA